MLLNNSLLLIQGVQVSLPIQRAHLDGLVVFVAVAELRGFRAAARQLGVTPSAISQTIRALEQRVGAPLLSRTTRSVGLTEAGERLLVHARPAMEMLSLGLDAAASLGDDVSGRLRINLPRAMLPLLANRLLPDFLEAYPNVQLELCGDDHFIDIVEQGFDAGIRMARSIPTDMIAVPLTPRIRFAVIAAASYIRKRGRPSRPRGARAVQLHSAAALDRQHLRLGLRRGRKAGHGPNQRIAHRQRCRGVPARRSARSRSCPIADFAGDELHRERRDGNRSRRI